MPTKKTEKKTLETYGDLLKFAEGLNEEVLRLGGVPQNYKCTTLKQRKACVLNNIFANLYFAYQNERGLHVDYKQPLAGGVFPVSLDAKLDKGSLLDPSFNETDFIIRIENRIRNFPDYTGETSEEYINKTLGTHQNWFKWLLSCIFDAPKSKQFMDGYSIFDAEQTNQKGDEYKKHDLYFRDDHSYRGDEP
ncbi:MAG: hypothetical protein P1U36_00410 [Legionellaceae bacterium]|nr:hypothetical protein [Legionellaceae bacterium]